MKHRIWKRMALGAMAAMLLWATACTEGQSSGGNAADEGETTVSKATITMEDGQQIHMTLDGEQAPITVENFAKLAKEGFYDGLTFHRIEPGFVGQRRGKHHFPCAGCGLYGPRPGLRQRRQPVLYHTG